MFGDCYIAEFMIEYGKRKNNPLSSKILVEGKFYKMRYFEKGNQKQLQKCINKDLHFEGVNDI